MARYATLDWDVNDSPVDTAWTIPDSFDWTEHDGGGPITDGNLDSQSYELALTRRYLGNGAFESLDPNGVVTDTRYSHGDLIDSAQLQTDEAGNPVELGSGSSGGGGWGGTGVSPVSYTAFGEPVGPGGAGTGGPVGDASRHAGLGTRYQYAGGWGYESNTGDGSSPLLGLPGAHAWGASGEGYSGANPLLAPITFQHLGWRWYQPDIGRFVQRDPIGIGGGLNVYLYCEANPLISIDPSGETTELPGGRPPVIPGGDPIRYQKWLRASPIILVGSGYHQHPGGCPRESRGAPRGPPASPQPNSCASLLQLKSATT